MHMTEHPDRRVWALYQHEVTRLLIDYAFTLEIWWRSDAKEDNSVSIIIENSFTLKAGEHTTLIDPTQTDSLGPALTVLHKPVTSLTAFRNGRLVIAFSDGTELSVERDGSYESWHTFGRGEYAGIGMLCSPHEVSPWGE